MFSIYGYKQRNVWKKGFEFLWKYIVKGAYIYIDDYGAEGYEETQKFYDDFAKKKGLRILKTPFCCALLQKIWTKIVSLSKH